jgi:uncharacterized protein (DUF1015 family)
MPLVRPFRGLLYADTRPAAVGRVLAPPFDMIGDREREALVAGSDHNIAWLTVARAEQDPGYESVAERLRTWRDEGVLRSDPQPAFYIHEQASAGGTELARADAWPSPLRGFLAAVRLTNPTAAAIYPHENIFERPLHDRLTLIRATRCHLEPVFGIYTDETGTANAILDEATTETPIWETNPGRGVVHRLWRMTDPTQQEAVSRVLADLRVVIADGHHRSAAARAYRDEMRAKGASDPDAAHEHFLMFLAETGTGGPNVGAFHRVIQRLPRGFEPDHCPALLGPHFEVEEFATEGLSDEAAVGVLLARLAEKGRSGPVFACRHPSRAVIVSITDLDALLPTAEPPIEPSILPFDVALLHRLILRPRLGCTGQYGAKAGNVSFEHNPLAAWRKASSGEAVMAWFVNPAGIHAVMRAALDGHTVPQKATYFYPKPASGMVIYPLTPDPGD